MRIAPKRRRPKLLQYGYSRMTHTLPSGSVALICPIPRMLILGILVIPKPGAAHLDSIRLPDLTLHLHVPGVRFA